MKYAEDYPYADANMKLHELYFRGTQLCTEELLPLDGELNSYTSTLAENCPELREIRTEMRATLEEIEGVRLKDKDSVITVHAYDTIYIQTPESGRRGSIFHKLGSLAMSELDGEPLKIIGNPSDIKIIYSKENILTTNGIETVPALMPCLEIPITKQRIGENPSVGNAAYIPFTDGNNVFSALYCR